MAECEMCHKMSAEVEYVANPYDADINNSTVMEWLCPICYQNCADDI